MAILEWIEKINNWIQPLVWGWPVLCAILLAGANFSFRLNFFQITHCKLWIKNTLGKIFASKKEGSRTSGISQFQALTTALAGSIGTGNIVGVATAITIGGPGAIFWMWMSSVLGMMTIFAENVLGMKYRIKNAKGEWLGGAMYYISRGIHSKPLAILFAGACVLASLGMGNMAQANSIAGALKDCFGANTQITGLVLAAMLVMITFGGIQRTAKVTEKLVPFMALGYLLAGVLVLAVNWRSLGGAFRLIFSEAFSLRAAAGGTGGIVMLNALKCGVSRGIFTNEAGLGSSVMAHSSSSGTEPVEQGMWGIFQVFIDTIVMCSFTALCILSTDVLQTGKDGAALSAAAFQTVLGRFGGTFISISIALFAFATMLAWCYYGQRGLEYIIGGKSAVPYRLVFAAVAWGSCSMDLHLVWNICDTFNGFMAIPNLIALFLLSGEVVKETQSYLARHNLKSDRNRS